MNPETINAVTQWVTLITLLVQYVGGIGLVVLAAIEGLRNKTVRWDRLIYTGIILLILPYGIRNYGPELTDASIDLLNNLSDKRPAMEDAITRFIGDVNEELPIVPDVPTLVVATPEFAATPFPTPSVNFAATATAYFENQPTAVPATPTATLEPTRYVCRTIQDIQAGCTPPTPIPGN